jgi:hypothetical protein
LFLILVAVGAGLCSAQTAGKKYYLVGGLFFEGMPPSKTLWHRMATRFRFIVTFQVILIWLSGLLC